MEEEGVVTNEGEEHPCIGCWMRVMVCPYGIIRSQLKEKLAVKCDRNCLDAGGTPACVRSCPTGALVYESIDHFSEDTRKDLLSGLLSVYFH